MQRYIKNKIKLLEEDSSKLDGNTRRQMYLGVKSVLQILKTGRGVQDLINLYQSFTVYDIDDNDHIIRICAGLEELYFIRDKFIEGGGNMKNDKREQLLDDIDYCSSLLDELKYQQKELQNKLDFKIREVKDCRKSLIRSQDDLDNLENESTINESGGKL